MGNQDFRINYLHAGLSDVRDLKRVCFTRESRCVRRVLRELNGNGQTIRYITKRRRVRCNNIIVVAGGPSNGFISRLNRVGGTRRDGFRARPTRAIHSPPKGTRTGGERLYVNRGERFE